MCRGPGQIQQEIAALIAANPDDAWTTGELWGLIFNRSEPALQWRAPLKPLGMEAAVKAIETQSGETTAAERQLELSLQQARYEVAYARRQYDKGI